MRHRQKEFTVGVPPGHYADIWLEAAGLGLLALVLHIATTLTAAAIIIWSMWRTGMALRLRLAVGPDHVYFGTRRGVSRCDTTDVDRIKVWWGGVPGHWGAHLISHQGDVVLEIPGYFGTRTISRIARTLDVPIDHRARPHAFEELHNPVSAMPAHLWRNLVLMFGLAVVVIGVFLLLGIQPHYCSRYTLICSAGR